MLVQVVGGGHRKDFIDIFPPAFVNSQIAQVNRPKILERMVFGSSPLCSEVFVTSLFFLFQIEDLEKAKSFRCELIEGFRPTCFSAKHVAPEHAWVQGLWFDFEPRT